MDTKTAYTQDGINFVSKARMTENIKYEYAKPGDYKEVQVPMDTIVVGASEYLEDTSSQKAQKSSTQTFSKQITTSIISENIIIVIIFILLFSAFIFHFHRIKDSKSTEHTKDNYDPSFFSEEDLLFDKAADLEHKGKYNEAIECYDKIIPMDPGYRESAWFRKGSAFYKQGKYDKALECADECLRLDPESYVYWSDKALALKELGRIAEYWYCMGFAYQFNGPRTSDLAEEAFRNAKELGYTG